MPLFRGQRLTRLCVFGLLFLPPLVGCVNKEARPTATPTAPTIPAADPPLNDEQRQRNVESFDYVWITIRDKHWDATLGGLNWSAVRDELRPKVETAQTMNAVRAVMWNMIGRLGQSHFGIIPGQAYRDLDRPAAPPDTAANGQSNSPVASSNTPASPNTPPSRTNGSAGATETPASSAGATPARETAKNETVSPPAAEPGDAGLEIRVVDGAALVTAVYADGPAARAGIKPGWEVLKVRNENIPPLVQKILAASKDSSHQEMYTVRALEKRFDGNVGERIAVVFRAADNREVAADIELGRPAGQVVQFGYLPKMYLRFESRRLEGNIGYIAFNAFLDPVRLMPAFEAAVTSFMDAEGIIVDLRGNPGGLGGMAMGLAGWFVDRSNLQLGVMMMRASQIKFAINPRPRTFNGPLAILVDGLSASTSEIMAGGLKDIGRARIFGTRTAGAALPSVLERLPNGDGFQYAIANYVSAGGEALEGRGVTPDQEVRPNRAALLAGRDPVMDAAIEWIRSQKKTARRSPEAEFVAR